MATQAEIDVHAQVLASVRASRDSFLESFGETAASVTEFSLGSNSLGFEIDPAGEKVLIKTDVALTQLGFFLLPTVSVFEFEDSLLRVPNSDLFMISYTFLFESEPGGPLPFFSTVTAFPNQEGIVEFGVSPSGFFAEYTYEYEGLVMGDDLIPAFREDFIANWRSASEVYAVLDVREIGSRLPEPNVGNDFIAYAGPAPDVAADALASQVFFGGDQPDDGTTDPEPVDPVEPAPDPTDPDTAGPTDSADSIIGAAQNDTISGLGGDDTIKGLGGDDLLAGGAGDDNIKGGGGDDRLRGNGGADTLKGNGGSDNIKGNGGDDIIKAGGGADTVKGGGGSDVINGGGGADLLNGGGGDDVITGKGGDDTLKAMAGLMSSSFAPVIAMIRSWIPSQGQDQIEIISGANTFAGLRIDQDGADVLIGFGAGQVRIVTDNANSFDESDFIF